MLINNRDMKTLVVGLGNPILKDDGVGLRVAEALKSRLDRPEVTVVETSMAGLSFLDLLAGYDKAIIIDAIQTEGGNAGQIYRLDLEALGLIKHAATPHDMDFITALALGKRLGIALPQEVVIFAIEVADASTFGEECTPEVRQAIPACVETIIQELKEGANA